MSELISRQLANEEISKYLQNVKDASTTLANIANAESKKYFTDTPHSFIFEKADILALWNANPTADGLKVYNASKPDGTATIVLVACKTNASTTDMSSANAANTNLINTDQFAALQYPVPPVIKASPYFDIATDNG
jgi:hypothetical protein